jgi:di/tricarboxylate transporter
MTSPLGSKTSARAQKQAPTSASDRHPQVHRRFHWPHVLSLSFVFLVVLIAIVAAFAQSVLPSGDWLGLETRKIAAAAVFIGSYLALAVGRIPGLNVDRAGIALVGAGLMVASGALPLADAYKAVDLDTITLLLGMMIIAASLRLSGGFFALAAKWVMERAKTPIVLLCGVVLTSGFLSAFLVNDAICIVLAPLVLKLTRVVGPKSAPNLLAVAMASNAGSLATMTGNPQNIMIGSLSHIPYNTFAMALTPIALFGLLVTVATIALFKQGRILQWPALAGSQARHPCPSRAGRPGAISDRRDDGSLSCGRAAREGSHYHCGFVTSY